MTEIYVKNRNGEIAKMALSTEQERAVYTVLGLKVADKIEDSKMYSDKSVSLITNAVKKMLERV